MIKYLLDSIFATKWFMFGFGLFLCLFSLAFILFDIICNGGSIDV